MNDAQTKALRRVLQRAVTRPAEKGFPFFYCQEGTAGEPVLLVQRRLSPGDIRAVRRTAKKKKFVQGIVFGDSGQLVFQAPNHTAGQFPKILRKTLGASVRALKKARVIGMDGTADEPELAPEPAGPAAPSADQQDAEAALDAALARLDGTQAAADSAERARQDAASALEAMIEQTPGLSVLSLKADSLASEATEAAEQVLDLQEALTAAELALDEKLADLDPKDLDPHAAAALAELSQSVTALREQIRTEAALAAGADARARAAQASLAEAVAARPELEDARSRLSDAEAALADADDAESRAEDAVFEAEAACEDAARLALLAPALAEAREKLAAHAETLAALSKINPREAGRKDRKRIKEAGAESLLGDLQAVLDALLAEGATLDDVRPLFDAVPSSWRPAALTEHMQWFQRLRDWEAAMDSAREAAKQQEEIEALLHGHDTDSARQAKLALQEHYRVYDEHKPPEGIDVNDAAELLSLLKASAAEAARRGPTEDPALSAEAQGIEGYDQAQDPVLKRMRDERMLELAASLGEEGVGWLALLATEVPGVALIFSGTNLAKELTQASLRIVKQVRTASLLHEAEEKDSVAVEALRQAKAREGLLAMHHSIQTVSAAFDVGTDVMVLTGGITLPVAFAVKIGSSIVANKIEELAVTDKERSIIARAEEYREAALAGDPEAARKLFKYSKRYAKGMLAWLAISGDEIAQKYAQMQGIPPEELEKTSPAVLQRYLLRASRELDEASETPSWLAKVQKKLMDILTRIGDYLMRKYEAIDAYFSGSAKTLPEVRPVSDRLLNALTETLRDFARKRAFLAQRPLHNALIILDLDEAREVFDRESDALQQTVSDNLAWLGTRQDDVADEIVAAADDKKARKAAEKVQARLEKAAAHNIALLQRLAALP